uniref:mTERF domain-containing protein 1, mitochondrial n=1 Tax=Lygus hesperus TaxID=30085 RepID=A0A0A9WEF6_LYGHE
MKRLYSTLWNHSKIILQPRLCSTRFTPRSVRCSTFPKESTISQDLVSLSRTEVGRSLSRPSVLDECLEDVSDYTLPIAPSFNLAGYVDRSPHLQELMKLGVNLDKIERTKGAAEVILRLDFERDAKPYIQFLHDHGVASEELGNFITTNPFIFKEDLENLQIRINYLEAKLFSSESISRIISKNPKWLSHSTKNIDHRLGFLQSLFSLIGPEVRAVATRMPKLITYPLRQIEVAKFGVVEEMGFTQEESKYLLLGKPKVYTIRREDAVARFSYIHNEMGISHSQIISQPDILTYRESRIRERHMFLKSIGKAQYDPKAPGYVSLKALMSSSDSDFCANVAKSTILVYNKFLKTM